MPLISHEIPKQLFPVHDLINDYPYVLAHLLLEERPGEPGDKEYADFYRKKLKDAPFSILDNSAFELGESIHLGDLMDLANEYGPTHVIIPDKVNDFRGTLKKFDDFIEFKSSNPEVCNIFKYIGVTQGEKFSDIYACIDRYINSWQVSLIALPFDLVPDSEFVTVRYRFLDWLINYYPDYEIKLRNRIHLLGCYNPVEFLLFQSNPEVNALIHSIDTSSPIVNGWSGNEFKDHGLVGNKPKDKLADNLDIKLSSEQVQLITKNVLKFREYVNW